MDTRGWILGFGAVLLFAASAPGADPAAGESDSVAQAGRPRYRTFEGRFGDVDRPRARPADVDNKGAAQKKPDMRHRDGQHRDGQHRSAKPGDQASKKGEQDSKKKDGPQHRKPELARDGRPDWKSRWKPSAGTFHARIPGPGYQGQFSGRHGGGDFGSRFAAASWRGPQRHQGHGQMGRHCGSGRCAFASMHGGRHKHGGMGHYAYGRHRGHGQMGRYGRGSFEMAHGRHGGHHGRCGFGKHGGHLGHHGQFAHRGGHHGQGGWQHRGIAMRPQHGSWGRNMAMARMAAMRWHHRGFAPGQFGGQGHGARGFAMNPWMMRSQWQGFGPSQMARGPQAGQRPQAGPGPQQFHRPWEAQVRPAGMPGRGPQARGGMQGDARLAELSARVERLQRELERLRREVR